MTSAYARRSNPSLNMDSTEYKSLREQLGLTQAGLALRLGVSRRTIIFRETGARITEEAALAILALKNKDGKSDGK